MLFPGKQPHNIFVMRTPGKNIQRKNYQIGSHHVRVHRTICIVEQEENHLRNAYARYPQKGTERAPLCKINEGYKDDSYPKTKGNPPKVFTRKRTPIHAESRSNPLPPFKLHRKRKDVPDDNKQSAKISCQIGHDKLRTGELIITVDEIADNGRHATLQRIARKGQQAYFPTKFSAHIHRTGITTADFCNVFMSFFRNDPRKVEATNQIANDCHNEKLPPVLRQIKIFFHNIPLARLPSLVRMWNVSLTKYCAVSTLLKRSKMQAVQGALSTLQGAY